VSEEVVPVLLEGVVICRDLGSTGKSLSVARVVLLGYASCAMKYGSAQVRSYDSPFLEELPIGYTVPLLRQA
jgi:hypothetical protein